MIIIDNVNNDNLQKALKTLKKKWQDSKTVEQLRDRKYFTKPSAKKGKVEMIVSSRREEVSFVCSQKLADQISAFTNKINISNSKVYQYSELEKEFAELFDSTEMYILKENGLLYL